MKRKSIALLIVLTMIMAISGCNSSPFDTKTATETTTKSDAEQLGEDIGKEIVKDMAEESKDAANIESDKNLTNIEVTLPASVDDITDEGIEELKKEDGYISITRNEDNSITYVMTKSKQKELLEKLEARFEEFANTTPGCADYPNITKLEVNNDFSIFTITTKATTKDEISLSETALAAVFYSFGGAYRGYSCDKDTSVTVEYVCDSTGEKIATGNSANIE